MTPLEALAQRLGLGAVTETRPGELSSGVSLRMLPVVAHRVVAGGGRLVTLFASDDRAGDGCFTLHHVWALREPRGLLRVSAPVDPVEARFPSIAGVHPAANWFEREVTDGFGLAADGHPNPQRVMFHDDWPEGLWPLRHDFPADRSVPRVAGHPHPFRPVRGEGVFQIPVGPIHAGIIEPGHFRFGVAGEPVLDLQLRLFYVHRGAEKRFEALPWRQGLLLAESIAGDSVVTHALAYAHAIEALAGIEVPARARMLRVVLLELERIDNHLADIAGVATDVAFSVPAAGAQVMRERLLRLQGRLFGTRLLRGTVALGGVRAAWTETARRDLEAHLDGLEKQFAALVELLIDSGSFTDRVDGTGILPRAAATDLAAVGVAARASGIDLDLRRDHPHDAYDALRFEVPVEEGGDVRARVMVRAREVVQSLGIVRQALEAMPAGPARAALPERLPARASALGWVEGWRGECVHWVQTGPTGALSRVKVTDPSAKNWPALLQAVPGNIVPDFPVINKSFNLSYAGNDR